MKIYNNPTQLIIYHSVPLTEQFLINKTFCDWCDKYNKFGYQDEWFTYAHGALIGDVHVMGARNRKHKIWIFVIATGSNWTSIEYFVGG